MCQNNLIDKWKIWLEEINREVTELIVNKHIYDEVCKIISRNPRIQKPSSFYNWMHRSYACDQVIRIGKLIDPDSQSISFIRLLISIFSNPKVFSRTLFCEMYHGSPAERCMNKDFDEYCQNSGDEYIDIAKIKADASEIHSKSDKLKAFRDTSIAHMDKKIIEGKDSLRELPTYQDLDECISTMERLFKKYYMLFTGVVIIEMLPVWQYEWKDIFREKWIVEI